MASPRSSETCSRPTTTTSTLYINGLLEILNEPTEYFVVDERASFQPYDRYYRPQALSATRRAHLVRWHGEPSQAPATG